MLFDRVRGITKHNYSRFYALVHITLAIRRWNNNNTGHSFLWEPIDTVVVILIEHPVLKQFSFVTLLVYRGLKLQLDWRLRQYHVQLQLYNSFRKLDKVRLWDAIIKKLKFVVILFEKLLTIWSECVFDELSHLFVAEVKDCLSLVFE